MKLFDYHIHTELSPDSATTLKEAIDEAYNKGLSEIAITDHFNFRPSGCHDSVEKFIDYYEKYKAFCEENKSGIPVKFGIEIGQCYLEPNMFTELINAVPYDFVLSSVHAVGDTDLYSFTYTKESIDYLVNGYLELVYKIADEYDFDCLAHINLIRRYAARDDIWVDFSKYEDKLIAILKRVVERNKGLEINTSGIRQVVKEAIPDEYIVSLFKRLGGKILTIGSDAHNIAQIGMHITEGIEVAKNSGFTEICTFENRTPIFHSI